MKRETSFVWASVLGSIVILLLLMDRAMKGDVAELGFSFILALFMVPAWVFFCNGLGKAQ